MGLAVTILQAIVFLSFVLYICIRSKSILPSISDGYYYLKENYDQGHFFDMFAGFIGVMMLLHTFGPFAVICKILFALSSVTMCMVAIASEFRKDEVDKYHYAGAFLTILFCVFNVVYTLPYMWPGLVAGGVCSTCITLLPFIKSKTFWNECVWFVFIIQGLLAIYGVTLY